MMTKTFDNDNDIETYILKVSLQLSKLLTRKFSIIINAMSLELSIYSFKKFWINVFLYGENINTTGSSRGNLGSTRR